MTPTHRQKQALDFIAARLRETGMSPTYAEIGAAIGCGLSSAHNLVEGLIDRRCLYRLPGRPRALSLTPFPTQRRRAFVLDYDKPQENGWPRLVAGDV